MAAVRPGGWIRWGGWVLRAGVGHGMGARGFPRRLHGMERHDDGQRLLPGTQDVDLGELERQVEVLQSEVVSLEEALEGRSDGGVAPVPAAPGPPPR